LPRKRSLTQKPQEAAATVPAKDNSLVLMVAISVFFLSLSIAYNYLTPAVTPAALHALDGGSPNPDEHAHMLYISTIASGRLPVFSKAGADYEAHQPPLYYLIAAIFYKIDHGVHFVRIAATLLGLVLIWVSFFTAKELLPNRPDIAATAAMIVAFLPMNVALSSSVSNDTAANLVFVLYLLVIGRILRGKTRTVKNSVLLAVIMAAGMWTKSSALILLPLTVFALAFAVWKRNLSANTALTMCAISVFGALLLTAPWLLRNEHLYGDLFAQHVVFHDLASRNIGPSVLIGKVGLTWYMQMFFGWTFASYWGVFDSMNMFLPTEVYILLAILSILTVGVGAVKLFKMRTVNDSAVLFTWTVLVALTVIAYVQYNYHFFQVQGRYLFLALLPVSVVSAAGLLDSVPASLKKWTALTLFAAFVILNLLALSMISVRYLS
jgi:hypothetical protein